MDPVALLVVNNPIVTAIVVAGLCWFLAKRSDSLALRFKVWSRLRFARKLKDALENYRAANGAYPLSPTFRPLKGTTRDDISAWLPELSSAAVQKLPRSIDNNSNGIGQWLYRSDGQDFKLIFHQPLPTEAELAFRFYTRYVDPERASQATAGAFGYWSHGAMSW
jgi:hypothetical protein